MSSSPKLTYFDKIMMAISFAEAGEQETAKNILNSTDRKQKRPEKIAERRPSLELQ